VVRRLGRKYELHLLGNLVAPGGAPDASESSLRDRLTGPGRTGEIRLSRRVNKVVAVVGAMLVGACAVGAGAGAATAAPAAAAKRCTTGVKLVPSCGVLWGAAAGGFTSAPRDAELKKWEKLSGRDASIFHTYHKGDEVFPTAAEIAMTRDPAHPRVLLTNWKIAYGSTWAKVAAGEQDKRIDKFAARVKAGYGDKKFFLVLNHEPENDVIARAGSGMQAKDFKAMYRHTIQRLKAQGLDNAINVMAYMGNEKWMAQSWWKDLYPGDDVVDWVGLDSYVSAEKGYYHYGKFADLLDRKAKGSTGPGWYDWAVKNHPGKPIMVAEWGVYHRIGHTADKSAGYASVLPELAKRPNIKAIVYFDTKHDDQGNRDISIDSTAKNLTAFKKLAANPLFNVKIS
jgi:beta-mannanase